jgi:hypothetical protein
MFPKTPIAGALALIICAGALASETKPAAQSVREGLKYPPIFEALAA